MQYASPNRRVLGDACLGSRLTVAKHTLKEALPEGLMGAVSASAPRALVEGGQ